MSIVTSPLSEASFSPIKVSPRLFFSLPSSTSAKQTSRKIGQTIVWIDRADVSASFSLEIYFLLPLKCYSIFLHEWRGRIFVPFHGIPFSLFFPKWRCGFEIERKRESWRLLKSSASGQSSSEWLWEGRAKVTHSLWVNRQMAFN